MVKYLILKNYEYSNYDWGLGIGDWGLGIGDWVWGLGIGPNPQSPIPNPQSPIPIYLFQRMINVIKKLIIKKN